MTWTKYNCQGLSIRQSCFVLQKPKAQMSMVKCLTQTWNLTQCMLAVYLEVENHDSLSTDTSNIQTECQYKEQYLRLLIPGNVSGIHYRSHGTFKPAKLFFQLMIKVVIKLGGGWEMHISLTEETVDCAKKNQDSIT